jgi:8-oxo-dGTP diphosphatase
MKKNNKIKIPSPKIRREWKIKPYTRVHSSAKAYNRRRRHEENQEAIGETLKEIPSDGQTPGTDHRFCPRCGGPLNPRQMDGRKRLVCSRCGFVFYRNPVPAVAVIIPGGGRIVLVRRAEDPRRGDWCLPAGFMELDETPEECAVREVKEETGLDIRVTELFGVDIGRDDPRNQVVLIIFLAELTGGEMRAGDDASEVAWYGPGQLPGRIAFATHRRALGRYFGEQDEQNISH